LPVDLPSTAPVAIEEVTEPTFAEPPLMAEAGVLGARADRASGTDLTDRHHADET
jgi:hypothetical protein